MKWEKMRWFYEIWFLGISETHISTIILNKMFCFHSLGMLFVTNRRWYHVSSNRHMFSGEWEDGCRTEESLVCIEPLWSFLLTSLAGWTLRGKTQWNRVSNLSYANKQNDDELSWNMPDHSTRNEEDNCTLRVPGPWRHEGPALRWLRACPDLRGL